MNIWKPQKARYWRSFERALAIPYAIIWSENDKFGNSKQLLRGRYLYGIKNY